MIIRVCSLSTHFFQIYNQYSLHCNLEFKWHQDKFTEFEVHILIIIIRI